MAKAINRNFQGFRVSYNPGWKLLSFTACGAEREIAHCDAKELKKLGEFLVDVANKLDDLEFDHPMGQS